jgi:hypothetical protein
VRLAAPMIVAIGVRIAANRDYRTCFSAAIVVTIPRSAECDDAAKDNAAEKANAR